VRYLLIKPLEGYQLLFLFNNKVKSTNHNTVAVLIILHEITVDARGKQRVNLVVNSA